MSDQFVVHQRQVFLPGVAVNPSYKESEFEDLVLSSAPELFPGYVALKLKVDLSCPTGVYRADLALVPEDYSHWWVVEVEMSHHSLGRHVAPQLEAFLEASYPLGLADTIVKEAPALDKSRVRDMLRGEQPRVVCVVNAPVPKWLDYFKTSPAHLMVAYLFRGVSSDRPILVVDNPLPSVRSAERVVCETQPLFPGLLRVEAPGILAVANGAHVFIKFEDGLVPFRRMDTKDGVFLIPVRSDLIPDDLRKVEVAPVLGSTEPVLEAVRVELRKG